VGGGPSLEELKKLAEAKGVADFVTFTGRVADSALLEVLNTADICVNPDEVNPMNDKSTMNKIMEYMALGKPIVQFDVTEGRFSAGDASLYAKPNDARDLAEKMAELLADPEKREAMGKFGRARVENELAWPYEAPKLLAAYDALFAGQK
jgi:glycosyltransferase involved in cell wall biosynthesis